MRSRSEALARRRASTPQLFVNASSASAPGMEVRRITEKFADFSPRSRRPQVATIWVWMRPPMSRLAVDAEV